MTAYPGSTLPDAPAQLLIGSGDRLYRTPALWRRRMERALTSVRADITAPDTYKAVAA